MNRYLITTYDLNKRSTVEIEEEANKLAGMGYRMKFSYAAGIGIVFVWEKG